MGPGGRVFCRVNGNGTKTMVGSAGYDSLRRPVLIEHDRDEQPQPVMLAKYRYGYDLSNNRLFEEKEHDPSRSRTFGYDLVDRLKEFARGVISGGTIPNPVHEEAFGLDGAGNRAEHGIDQATYTNAMDPLNRYVSTYDGSLNLAYDGRGNTVIYGDLLLTYDVYGRIVAASGPGVDAFYLYDGLDRRLLKRVNGEDTLFVMEGDRVLEDVDGSTGGVAKQYVWGSGIDDLVLFEAGQDLYHVHRDALGSPVLLTDSSGEAVEGYDYDPFGACQAEDLDGGGLVGNPYRFTGRRLDEETGLYYFRARHYSTEMGVSFRQA